MYVDFHPVFPWPIIAAMAAILMYFTLWTYTRETPARRLLITLRWVAIALAVLVMLRPSLVFSKTQKQSAVLAILADKSKSMMLRDMWDDQTRWQVLTRELADSDADLKTLAEEVQIREFEFARTVSEPIARNDAPKGDQTAIGDAIQQVLRQTAGTRLAGIVLLTDGANTGGISPITVARQLRGQKIPIHTVGFGRETVGEEIRDIAARSIATSATVFAKNKMTVAGEFAATGFSQSPITVRLLLNGIEASRKELTLTGDSTKGVVELTGIPEIAGDVKVTLEAMPQPGELLSNNNSVSTYVTVLSGGISVLAIEGKYRFWEPKYLRWALDQSPDIELNQIYLLEAANRQQNAPPDLFKPGRFDVYILGDINSNRFRAEDLQTLKSLVERGAGLMMMGGYESFGPGGWGSTPLADVLPVLTRPGDAQIRTPIKVTPTAAGLRHFILRMGATDPENSSIWSALKPLDGGSGFSGIKPGGLLLATSPDGLPVLAAQDVGAGRAIAFAGDTTWRWRATPQGALAHARFWRQLILWLARKEEQSSAGVRVKLASRRLSVGQKLPIQVKVEALRGLAPPPQVLASVLTPSGSTVPVELFRQGDEYRGSFWQTETAGDYSVRVAATAENKTVGSSTVKFLVYDEDTEMRQLAADMESLRNIATTTSGEFLTPEKLPRFFASLKDRDLNLEVLQLVQESLWDRWEVLALFIALLAAEWIVRKRNGMA